ncbi:hypothetical protein BABINDRAFT_159066 [Babjeviella inositovora NRRL Y-12698]|uniref:Ataxin-10 homolog n=1 Tax=Babjeviella inositovora NRRL Y-12698 TaxID=984486 RepID=A0A1E3QXT8_9ASCO|nr:uncharacterized protein BABINDRAFT_159066 [Babjeviella inositovora NRRL Y-12698]ODQ82488.1 hypothetical protein BABINDRAFT_159066 [Babjeviella inositovora NRRL Y-12698]
MEEILQRVLSILSQENNLDIYPGTLTELGAALQRTVIDEEFRITESALEVVWNTLVQILQLGIVDGACDDETEFRLRILRGAVLMARNLAVNNQSIPAEIGIHGHAFCLARMAAETNEETRTASPHASLYHNLYIALWQLLANLSAGIGVSFRDWLAPLSSLPLTTEDVRFPAFRILDNMFASAEVLSDALNQQQQLVSYLLVEMVGFDTDHELPPSGLALVTLLTKIVSHEGFGEFLSSVGGDKTLLCLQLVQLVVTSQKADYWDNYEVTAMLVWIWERAAELSARACDILPRQLHEPAELASVHAQLLILLDLLSDLAKYEEARSFLTHYNAVETLVGLLGNVHAHTERVTIKDRGTRIEDATKKYFPHIKSLVVEILAFLTFENFEVQEQIRNFHGLQLALACCNIDDNDPYIKERLIILLRYLLANNPKNQEYVALLEAREAVNDEVLEEAGFEVDILEGRVKLKQTNREEIMKLTKKGVSEVTSRGLEGEN